MPKHTRPHHGLSMLRPALVRGRRVCYQDGVAPIYPELTGVILAGGQNRRMGGRNKALLPLGEERFIDRLAGLFGPLFGRVMIVTNKPLDFSDLPVGVVRDLKVNQGAIMGLITALLYAPTDWVFVSACDTPLLQESLIRLIVDNITPRLKVVAPDLTEGFQPLTAAYHCHCLPPLRRLFTSGARAIRLIYPQLPVCYLKPDQIKPADPAGLSFFNVNSPQDLVELERLYRP